MVKEVQQKNRGRATEDEVKVLDDEAFSASDNNALLWRFEGDHLIDAGADPA